MTRLNAVLVAALLLTIGCATQSSDFVGHWTLADTSRRYLPSESRSAQAQFDLRANGTFTAAQLPQVHIEPNGPTVTIKSGSGTWRILSIAGQQIVQLTFADGVGMQLEISNVFAGRPNLHYFLADPDSGQRLEYART